jgi:cyclophilin family peptidyl-prolyl cis-trans isomerase
MRSRIVVSLMSLLLLGALPVSAADPAPKAAKPGSQAAEFRALHGQMNDIEAQLAKLQIEYRTANEDKRADIQQKYKDLIAKGMKIAPRLIEAAKKTYQESPNADKQVVALLLRLMAEDIDADDYEPAAAVGKLLMENKCNVKALPNMAGVAAFAASDFGSAEKYLSLADSQGFYKSASKEDELAMRGKSYLQAIPHYKKAWAMEKAFRAREAKAEKDPRTRLPRVLLKTNKGEIELELFEDQAPNTVANFISLVKSGYYKNVTFHRVIKGFMAQGGDPQGTGGGGPGYTIPDECRQPNHREHFRGTLSMAKTSAPDSGGSQFFLTFVPTPHLDGAHTAFGRVIRGMDVLARIQRRDPQDKEAPRADKIIEATVIQSRPHEYKPQKMPD